METVANVGNHQPSGQTPPASSRISSIENLPSHQRRVAGVTCCGFDP